MARPDTFLVASRLSFYATCRPLGKALEHALSQNLNSEDGFPGLLIADQTA